MKTPVLLAALLALSALPAAAADGTVTVHFSLTLGSHAGASHKTCDVQVAPGSDGGQVLDAAAAQGCISGWGSGFGGAYARCIDGVCEQNAGGVIGTFWGFYVDEQLPCGGSCGIRDVQFQGGESAEFAYVDWFTPFLVPL